MAAADIGGVPAPARLVLQASNTADQRGAANPARASFVGTEENEGRGTSARLTNVASIEPDNEGRRSAARAGIEPIIQPRSHERYPAQTRLLERLRATRKSPAVVTPQVVRITIGRVDVRAVQAPIAPVREMPPLLREKDDNALADFLAKETRSAR
jgi:hypothetical protein